MFQGRNLSIVLSASVTLGATLAAQGQSPQTDRPVFRSGTQTIEVDVRVFDRDGRFVPDLKPEDFEVFEDGVSQPIGTVFMVETDGQEEGAPAAASSPAGPMPVVAARQTWIFAFDLNHLVPGRSFDTARKAVEQFIATRLPDGDLAGILSGEKMLNNRLTSVREELLRAVKEVKPRGDARSRLIQLTREWPRFQDEEEAIRAARGEPDVLSRAIARAASSEPDASADPEAAVRAKAATLQQEIHRATMQSLGALSGLAHGLARVPGPKTIVFLSDGFVAHDISTVLRSVADQTARAGARVYAIDVRGLSRGSDGMLEAAQAADAYSSTPHVDTLADGPNSLAVDTGGLMIRNENNIGRAIERVAEDASRAYVLTYSATNTDYDGSFRRIEVRVKRPGVRVRARPGYLALDPSRMLVPQPIK